MLAAIDAGSNTLRLLVGEVVDGKVVPAFYLRRICRLSGGFSKDEGLAPAAMERALVAFREFAETCRQSDVSHLQAIGTAAFRQAVNGADFAREVMELTGLPLEIVSGDREANLTASGVLSALDPVPERSLIVDIGGGSTEFVICAGEKAVWSCSLPLGVVRLTEGHASAEERSRTIEGTLAELNFDIAKACSDAGIPRESLTLVGTAGTATTLAALDMKMTDYDWRRVNNHVLSLATLREMAKLLQPMTPAEREALPGMETGRGDLIPAGLEIILGLMRLLQVRTMIVSDFGILEGLLLSLYENVKNQSVY